MNLINVFQYLQRKTMFDDLLLIYNTPMTEYNKIIEKWNLKINVDELGCRKLSANYMTKLYLEQRTYYTKNIEDIFNVLEVGDLSWIGWYQQTIWNEYKFVCITLAMKKDDVIQSQLTLFVCNNLMFDCYTNKKTIPFTKFYFNKYYGKYNVIRGVLFSNNDETQEVEVKVEVEDPVFIETEL